jgi:hypothetical protein
MSARLSYRTRRTAKLIEPGKRPLHNPAPTAQSIPVRGTTHGASRHDVPRPQSAPNRRRVVAAIPENTLRPLPRSPRFAVQRRAASPPVANQMALAPALQPGRRVRANLVGAKWIRAHTPACCQSRKRRQHVIPDQHASSRGSICQEMPLRRTKTMPVRHARSGTRGLPPFGRRGGIGRNGTTRSHNGSGSSAAAIAFHATSPTPINFRRFCYALLAIRVARLLGC